MNFFKIIELSAGDNTYYWTYNRKARYKAEKVYGKRLKVFEDGYEPTLEEELYVLLEGMREGHRQKGIDGVFSLTWDDVFTLDEEYGLLYQISQKIELDTPTEKKS